MNAAVMCSKAADTALFARPEGNRLYFHGTQIQLDLRKSTLESAGCKGLQVISYDTFTEQKEKPLCSM